MTYPQFLDALGFVKREWTINASGEIRTSVHVTDDEWIENSPLQVVAHRRHLDDRACGLLLGLPEFEQRRITDAANDADGHKAIVRADLIRACGLEEPRHLCHACDGSGNSVTQWLAKCACCEGKGWRSTAVTA